MDRLTERGMVDAIPHATPLLSPTRRHYLTAHGLHVLAQLEGVALDELLRRRPVSAQWRRILLERLDALAVMYRLAAAVSSAAFPTRIRLFRAAPADAGFVLPDGRTVAVVRQGNTADRTGFSKRLWRLREGPLPGGVLVLAPDDVRLRQARRMLAGASFPVFLALERDAALAGLDSPVWRLPIRRRRPGPALRAFPPGPGRRVAGGSNTRAGVPARRHRPGRSGPGLAAAHAAEARREARPGPALRLALGVKARPGRADGSVGAAGVAGG